MVHYFLISAFFSLLASAVAYFYYVQNSKFGKSINRIPGPKVVPIFGNLLDLDVSAEKSFKKMTVIMKKYYPVFRLWTFNKATIHISHPDDVEVLLSSTKHINKKYGYEPFCVWLKSGLLTSSDPKWRERRKMLTPAFHLSILKRYFEIVNENGEKLIADIQAMGKEVKLSLLTYCSKHTLNIICESAMGISFSDEKDAENAEKYRQAVRNVRGIMFYRIFRPYIRDWMIPFMPNLQKKITDNLNHLNGFANKVIKERREYHESTNFRYATNTNEEVESDPIDLSGRRKRLSLLDLLLDAERRQLIDNDGIVEEVSNFIFAGHDSPSITLSFLIMMLAGNKDCQEKARKEVTDIMKQKNGVLDMDDLHKFNYLERCIKESLRLVPTVPYLTRYMIEDFQLKNFLAPKNSDIVVNIADMHRDPQFWEEPEKFIPDRFLPEEVEKRHPFVYIPFSGGIRSCIGQKFGMMEMKLLMARILYNFYLEPIDYTTDFAALTNLVQNQNDQTLYAKFISIDRH